MIFTADGHDGASRIRNYLRSRLSGERCLHSELTASCAATLCMRFGCDPEKGFLAGLAHDIARDLEAEALLDRAQSAGIPLADWEKANPVLIHGKVGAELLRHDLGISDPDILEAVSEHTMGAPGMGRLARVLYVADYLEAGRKHVDPDFRDELMDLPLDMMLCRIMEKTFEYLTSRGKTILGPSVALFSELCANETG